MFQEFNPIHFLPLLQIWAYVGVAASVLTAIFFFVRRPQSLFIEWLKNFIGALFLFSGAVKAVDPMGTSLKMQDYFAELSLSSLNSWTLFLAIGMIVLEMYIGINLVLGVWKKTTLLIAIPLMVYFTLLTGYTALTGRVTDCGCFGDFLKLKPYVSFIKDIILLAPISILYLQRDKMTTLFTSGAIGAALSTTVTIGWAVFCVQNYYWDEPIVDFRPFKIGTDIVAAKAAEQEKVSKNPITFVYKNKADGKELRFTAETMPKDLVWADWELKERIEQKVEVSKVADYLINGPHGEDITPMLTSRDGYSFAVIVSDREHTDLSYFKEINELAAAAQKDNVPIYGVMNISDSTQVANFTAATKTAFPFFTADEKLLKTMIRSNPGVFLFKKGLIVHKWHRLKLPDYAAIKGEFLK